jgi:hypothetical protein
MTHHSFFHLVPSNDLPEEHDSHLAWCASLSEAEHHAAMEQGMALGEQLFEAIDAYCAAHQETSYGVILEALRYMQWYLERELAEESADA